MSVISKTLASLVYQCFSCTNVVGKIHVAWTKIKLVFVATILSCYVS